MTKLLEEIAERFDILGVQISAVDLKFSCQMIEDLIRERKKGYVCVCPVSTIMECVHDANVMRVVNNATLVTPDGMPAVWIGRRRGFKDMGRVYGPDLMLAMCERSALNGYRNYLYGATDDVLEELETALKKRFPGLNICGKFAPPFRLLTEEEDRDVVKRINAARPDLLWVGLGSPKQDLWIDSHRTALEVPVMLAVGAAFDFLSGTKPQAPRWMQRIGLEWLFRLCIEPRRLGKRYIIGNTQFVYLLAKNYLTKKDTRNKI